jgi:hypothetical protein
VLSFQRKRDEDFGQTSHLCTYASTAKPSNARGETQPVVETRPLLARSRPQGGYAP